MTCFMFGHRDTPERIIPLLKQCVEQHISEYGVTEFIVGHYGAFDRVAAGAVREAKRLHPNVSLVLLLPYYRSDSDNIEDGFDGTFYPEGQERVPKRAAIVRANRYAIARCDYVIAYQCYVGSNAREFLDYARNLYRRTGTPHVTNLADEME